MTYSVSQARDMLNTLDGKFQDHRHRRVLDLFRLTGVADQQQIYAAAALSRHKFTTLLAHFRRLADDNILAEIPDTVPQPGVRGRPSTVYVLGPAGAALLRALGHEQAHACGYREIKPLAHARTMVALALGARDAGLTVRVEEEIAYADGQVIRPDLVVTLPDGQEALFEIEHDAGYATLEMKTGVQARRAAFFQTDASAGYSPIIRTIFNLAPGRTLDDTIATWERANATVAEAQDGTLPYEHVGLTLAAFLENPDWGEPPDPDRWFSLIDPAQQEDFGLAETNASKSKRKPPPLATADPYRPESNTQSYLIMRAYLQHLHTYGADLLAPDGPPAPSPHFFGIWQVIYAPSHPLNPTPVQQARHPQASLYLLRTYLELHPPLHKALAKAIRRGGSGVRWSASLILHRMQNVINLFLRYHGYRGSPTLQAVPVPSWRRRPRKDFGIQVKIHPELLMPEGEDGLVPMREEVERAEQALAWVLWSLFSYAEDLGLPRAKFW